MESGLDVKVTPKNILPNFSAGEKFKPKMASPAFHSKPRPVPQFPPTPKTIIKPPRFYSNQSLIVPRSKPTGPTTESENNKECVCERPEAIVICRKCGSELLGRIQMSCPAHPRKMCLMDQRECPSTTCRSIALMEITLED